MCRSILNRSQCTQRRLLRLGEPSDLRDIEPLIESVTPQYPQLLAALEVPQLNGIVITTTGQYLSIGTHAERLDCPLMPLLHPQALPTLHVPPAQHTIAIATEQQCS